MPNLIESALQPVRCAFYGRFVSAIARPQSIEYQLKTCKEFADSQGWIILEEHVYQDAAGLSISGANREQLEALKAAAKSTPRTFDYVLLDDMMRLSRNPAEVEMFVKFMNHYGVGVSFVDQRLDTKDEYFEILLSLHTLIDRQYVERLRVAVKAGKKRRAIPAS